MGNLFYPRGGYESVRTIRLLYEQSVELLGILDQMDILMAAWTGTCGDVKKMAESIG